MPTADRGRDDLLVDDALRRAGVDLWGAGANEPSGAHAPGLPVAISLLARIDGSALVRLEQGEPAAYRAEYRRLNGLLDEAVAALVTALQERGHEAAGATATIYSELPESGDWLAAGVLPTRRPPPARAWAGSARRGSSCRPRPAPRCAWPRCSPTCRSSSAHR